MNIRNDDIADGNPKLTLGLIWTIILHFQVSSSVSVVFNFIIALFLCLWDLDLSAAISHLLGTIRGDSSLHDSSMKGHVSNHNLIIHTTDTLTPLPRTLLCAKGIKHNECESLAP